MVRAVLIWAVVLIVFACAKKPISTSETLSQNAKEKIQVDTVKNNPLSTIFLIEALGAKHLGDFDNAINLLKQATVIDSKNDAAYFQLASLYQTEEFNNNEAALKNIRKAYEIKPQNKLYQLSLARLLVDNEEFDEGIAMLQTLVNNNHNNIDYHYDLAYAYEQAGKPNLAIKIYDNLEDTYGFNPELNYKKHILYFAQGQQEKGVQEIKEIVDSNPQYVTYAVFLAEYYLKNKDYKQAENYASLALKQEKENAKAFAIQLQALARQNKKTEFLIVLQQLIDSNLEFDAKVQLLYPLLSVQEEKKDWSSEIQKIAGQFANEHADRAEAYALYGDLLFNSGKTVEAEKQYIQSLAIKDDVYSVWDQLMNYYIYQRDYKKLGPFAEQATQKFPDKAFPAYISGYAYYRDGKTGNAVRVLKRATERQFSTQEFDIDILSLLGDAYHKNKQYNDAYLAYDKVLLKDPDNAHVLNNYSYYLAEQKQNLAKAEKMAARAVELNPQDANTLDTYGWVLFQKGNYDKAEEVLAQAVKAVPDSSIILEHYGDALYKNGKIELAVTYWKKAYAIDEDNLALQQKINTRQLNR